MLTNIASLVRRFARSTLVTYRLKCHKARLRQQSGVRIGHGTTIDLHTHIEQFVTVGTNCDVSSACIGTGTYIVDNCVMRHTKIGRFCAIADGVRTGLGTHPTHTYVSIHPAFFSTMRQAGFSFVEQDTFDELPRVRQSCYAVEIGNDVWLGSGVRVRDGIRIGDGAIVGAGAVVVRDLEPYSINVGVPAKTIRFRFTPREIEFLREFRWWDRDFTWLRTNAHLFQNATCFFEFLATPQ